MRSVALFVLITIFIPVSCQSDTEFTPAVKAMESVLLELQEHWDSIDDEDREPGWRIRAIAEFRATGWVPTIEEDASGFSEQYALFVLLAQGTDRSEGGQAASWKVLPSKKGREWIELKDESGQLYRARLQTADRGWRCDQMDPVFPPLDSGVESREEFALALAQRLLDIELAMPSSWSDESQSEFYISLAGSALVRALGGPTELGPEPSTSHGSEALPADAWVANVMAPTWFHHWRVGLANGWEQRIVVDGVDTDGRVRLALRQVDEDGESRAIGIAIGLERQSGHWVVTEEPGQFTLEGVLVFQFNLVDGKWHLKRN